MSLDIQNNFAWGTVLTAPSPASSGTTIVLTAGHGARFPAAPFNLVVAPANTRPLASNSEIVRVTAISVDTLTITRAQESSSARTIIAGDQIFQAVTKKTFTDITDQALLTSSSPVFAAVGIGVTPATLLHVATSTTALGMVYLEQASADSDSFDIKFMKARGTVALPTVITTADELGIINFRGYSGAGGYVTGAAIKVFSAGTIATTRVAAYMSFWTGTDAAPTVLTERMRINQAGLVGIGTASPTYTLHIASVTGTAGQTVFIQDATASTGATSVIINGGAGQSTTTLFNIALNGGTNTLFSVTPSGTIFWQNTTGKEAIYAPAHYLSSDVYFTWGNGTNVLSASFDVSLSRISAGLLGVGTGAQGSFAGGLKLTNITHVSGTIGFNGATPVVQQTGGANVTNNVTSGGSSDVIANFTDLTLYANDSAAIRNNIYQLARLVKQDHDALRAYGLLT